MDYVLKDSIFGSTNFCDESKNFGRCKLKRTWIMVGTKIKDLDKIFIWVYVEEERKDFSPRHQLFGIRWKKKRWIARKMLINVLVLRF